MTPYMDTGISTSAHRTQNFHSNSLINPDSYSEALLETAQLQTLLWAGFLLFWFFLSSAAAADTRGLRAMQNSHICKKHKGTSGWAGW